MNKDLGGLLMGVGVIAIALVMAMSDPVSVTVVSDGNGVQVIEGPFGASSGPEHFNEQVFRDGFINGGDTHTSSTLKVGTVTMSGTQACDYSVVSLGNTTLTQGIPTLTWTSVSSTTLHSRCLPFPGQSRTFLFRNLHPTAATTTTIAAGTGITLVEHDGGDVVIPGGEWAILKFTNVDNAEYLLDVRSLRGG